MPGNTQKTNTTTYTERKKMGKALRQRQQVSFCSHGQLIAAQVIEDEPVQEAVRILVSADITEKAAAEEAMASILAADNEGEQVTKPDPLPLSPPSPTPVLFHQLLRQVKPKDRERGVGGSRLSAYR